MNKIDSLGVRGLILSFTMDQKLTQAQVTTPPLPHQVEGIQWLVKNEQNPAACGGLLADDMGLGKTYQIIAATMMGRATDEQTRRSPLSPTLVVAPKTLLLQWRSEILQHTTLTEDQIVVYHGNQEKRAALRLSALDGRVVFVLTTYHRVRLDEQNEGLLVGKLWDRIILDEAHVIRNRKSKITRACLELRSVYRWCLTGTAFNNASSDLATLCGFLRFPEDKRWWETCSSAQLVAWREQHMLRRTKSILNLPPLTVEVQRVEMTEEEQSFYDKIVSEMTADYKAFLSSSGVERSRLFQYLLVWLLRMRQACNDPLLLLGRSVTLPYARLAKGHAPCQRECSRCERPLSEVIHLECGHVVCSGCRERPCVYCFLSSSSSSSSSSAGVKPSSKTRFLVKRLLEILEVDPTRKIIVYSQWTSCLDLVEAALRDADIGHHRLDGDVTSIDARHALLTTFASDQAPVLLASLHAGGLGLNLACASSVIFLDLWYNPMVELQAMNRVHRIGQTRPVHVEFLRSTFVVEEAIAALQIGKRRAAEYYIDGRRSDVGTSAGINAGELTGVLRRIIRAHKQPQASAPRPLTRPKKRIKIGAEKPVPVLVSRSSEVRNFIVID